MPQFSKIILPPVLNYTYPGFCYEKEQSVTFHGALSITNNMTQIDHIQVRIVSLDTNKNGLNPTIFPTGFYFIPVKNIKNLDITLKTIINGESIFKNSDNDPYPSYYKMQVRLGEKRLSSSDNYDSSWGQNVPQDWILKNNAYFSEWSNSAILKTVKKPDFGIFTLKEEDENIISDPNYNWLGYYYTEDDNESLEKYSFKLEDESLQLLEQSDTFYIGEYEKPSLQYKFREVLEHNRVYYLTLHIETITGYQEDARYRLKTNFDYVKIYNILEIKENEDDAHNLVDIRARQIHLIPQELPQLNSWKEDTNMSTFGETGITHYVNSSNLYASNDFTIPYENFSILLSISNFKDKILTNLKECFYKNNYILFLGNRNNIGERFYLGSYMHNNQLYFVLKEEFLNGQKRCVHYYIEKAKDYKDNNEYFFLIQKNKGDTVFECVYWHDNKFKE